MKVINPSKMTREVRAMFDDDITEMHICEGAPLSECYTQYGEREFGKKLYIMSSKRGWHCGFLARNSRNGENLLEEEMRFVSSTIIPEMQRFVDLKEHTTADVDRLRKATDDLREFTDGLPKAFIRKVASRLVFGVSHDSVAIALFARECESSIDLFFEDEEFYEFYTMADWHHICTAMMVFATHSESEFNDPNQLKLFSDSESDWQSGLSTACRSTIRDLVSLGPCATADLSSN